MIKLGIRGDRRPLHQSVIDKLKQVIVNERSLRERQAARHKTFLEENQDVNKNSGGSEPPIKRLGFLDRPNDQGIPIGQPYTPPKKKVVGVDSSGNPIYLNPAKSLPPPSTGPSVNPTNPVPTNSQKSKIDYYKMQAELKEKPFQQAKDRELISKINKSLGNSIKTPQTLKGLQYWASKLLAAQQLTGYQNERGLAGSILDYAAGANPTMIEFTEPKYKLDPKTGRSMLDKNGKKIITHYQTRVGFDVQRLKRRRNLLASYLKGFIPFDDSPKAPKIPPVPKP